MCFNHRTKIIIECANIKVDEKLGIKEKMVDYNSDEEQDNIGIVRQNVEFITKTNNDLHNGNQIEEMRSYPRVEERVYLTTPSRSIEKNHRPKQIIGRRNRNQVNEEVCKLLFFLKLNLTVQMKHAKIIIGFKK